MWESYLLLRNIELGVAYIRWLVPSGPYLNPNLKLVLCPKKNWPVSKLADFACPRL